MSKFDLTTIYNDKRPLSWSAISLFEWNPGMWYDKYISGEKPLITPELEFGSRIDKKIQKDPDYIPSLVRYPIMQHKMKCDWGDIPLIGYADTYDDDKVWLRDYKTGKKDWDQKRTDETGQLTMYLFMLYLTDKGIKVEEARLFIDWLPTHIRDGKIEFRDKPVKPFSFETKRTMRDVLKFGQRIKDTWTAMEIYAANKTGTFADNLDGF